MSDQPDDQAEPKFPPGFGPDGTPIRSQPYLITPWDATWIQRSDGSWQFVVDNGGARVVCVGSTEEFKRLATQMLESLSQGITVADASDLQALKDASPIIEQR